ncbi:MAG: hypothetical protein Phog2KO_35020 [Phototrophicaceae bacterium]
MQTKTTYNSLFSASIAVLISIIAWTLYVLLMNIAPEPFANDMPRALARVFVVLLPAIFHILRQKDVPKLDYLQLKENWLQGFLIGVLIASIYLAFTIATTMENPMIALPVAPAIWFNFIIGSPFAEELLFRGVLFNELNRVTSSYLAIIISALLFAILHLPVWIILDGMPIGLLAQNFIQIFIYGLIFAMMMKFTKSLWTPLSAHWLNNFILLSVIDSV